MASLTPLSKGIIGLAIVGAMASAVWHLALKERFAAKADPAPMAVPSTATTGTPSVAVPAPEPAPAVTAAPTPPIPTPPTAPSAPVTAAPAPSPAPPPPTTAPSNNASADSNAEQGRQALSRGDFAQARKHLELAVRDGNGAAACLLGDMTLKGQGGIPANQEKAAALYQTAQARNTICFAAGG